MKKKYFWIKIQEDFYRQKEIKILRQMENGAVYIIIYQKMLIHSLKHGNKLFYDNLKDSFEEELALLIDEDVEDVKTTVAFLKKTSFIEYIGEDEYALTQVDELTGTESESANRVRKHRENKKKDSKKVGNENKKEGEDSDKLDEESKRVDEGSEKLDGDDKDKTCCNAEKIFCNKNVTTDIELEKELDKDLDKELEKDTDTDTDTAIHTDIDKESDKKSKTSSDKNPESKCVSTYVSENLSKIIKLYEENIGIIYPANRQYFIDISEKIHWSLFKRAIEICIDKNNMTPAYLKGIIKKWQNKNIYTLEDLESKKVGVSNKTNYKNKFPVGNNVKELAVSNMEKASGNNRKIYELKNNQVLNKYNLKNNHPANEAIDQEMLREMRELEKKLGVS